MEGAYEFMIDDQRFLAGPGDTAYVPIGVAHAFWNRGSTPGRLLFGLTPAADGEAFFHERATFIGEAGPLDVAAINEHFVGRFEIVGPPLAVLLGGHP